MKLDETTLPVYARGTAILGAGRGGPTRTGLLAALQAVEDKGPVEMISLEDVPHDELIIPGGRFDSPDVLLEKQLCDSREGMWLQEMIEWETGKRVCALMPGEVGGSNGLAPVKWAAHTGLPIVDANGTGRALPEAQMINMHVARTPATRSGLIEKRGLKTVLRNMDAVLLEHVPHPTDAARDCATNITDRVFTGAQARGIATPGSVSRALRIGRALAEAPVDRVHTLLDHLGSRVLMTGKVSGIEHRTNGGFGHGEAMVDSTGIDHGRLRLVRVEIRKENLLVLQEGGVVTSKPSIITLLDAQTGDVTSPENLCHGQRSTLVVSPAPDIWPTPDGLAIASPRTFSYDFDYQPLE